MIMQAGDLPACFILIGKFFKMEIPHNFSYLIILTWQRDPPGGDIGKIDKPQIDC